MMTAVRKIGLLVFLLGFLSGPLLAGRGEKNTDMAIIVNFPEKPIPIPNYRSFWYMVAHWFDFNRDGMAMVGHTGVILVDGEDGRLEYWDMGRYDDRNDLMGPRPDFYGVVRSARFVPALAMKIRAEIKNGWITNLDEILVHLGVMSLFKDYGRIDATVVYHVDLEKMQTKATNFENEGFIYYGAPAHLYCTNFVRKVIRAGGQGFKGWVYTGEQTIRDVERRFK